MSTIFNKPSNLGDNAPQGHFGVSRKELAHKEIGRRRNPRVQSANRERHLLGSLGHQEGRGLPQRTRAQHVAVRGVKESAFCHMRTGGVDVQISGAQCGGWYLDREYQQRAAQRSRLGESGKEPLEAVA
jgi:hypothetical protein